MVENKKQNSDWIIAAVQACIVVAVVFGVAGVIGLCVAVGSGSLDGFAYSMASVASGVFFWGFAGIIALVLDISRQ